MPENILKMIVIGKRFSTDRTGKILLTENNCGRNVWSLEMLHFLYFPSLVQFETNVYSSEVFCMHFKIGKLLHLSSFNSFLILILLCTTCKWLPVLCICKYRQYQFVNSVSNFYNYVTLSYPLKTLKLFMCKKSCTSVLIH